MFRSDQIRSCAISCVGLLLTAVLLSAVITRADDPAAKTATPAATKGEPDPKDPQVAAKLAKRQKLLEQVQVAYEARKLSEMMKHLEDVLDLERELLGIEHAAVHQGVHQISDLFEGLLDDFTSSRRVRQKELDLLTAKFGRGNWQVEDARRALEDITLRERLIPEQRQQLREADQLHSRVIQSFSAGKTQEALDFALEAEKIRKKLLGEEHPDYVQSLNDLARIYLGMADYANACLYSGSALA